MTSLKDSKVEIYGKDGCTYCTLAKQHFTKYGMSFTYHDLAVEGKKDELTGRLPENFPLKQVPQIFINDKHVGGYMDLTKWFLANTKLADQ